MNTCGTCKFFATEQNRRSLNDNGDDMYVPSGFHECLLVKMEEGLSHGDIACVVDGSGYYAALCVKEEFGRVLHEVRE